MYNFYKKISYLVVMVVMCQLFFSSCATIFSGTKQQISFISEPPDATVVAIMKNGSEFTLGKTPCAVEVQKKTRKNKLNKNGFEIENNDLRKNPNIHWGYWADFGGALFFGTGVVPMIIDIANNSYLVFPQQIKTELKKK